MPLGSPWEPGPGDAIMMRTGKGLRSGETIVTLASSVLRVADL